MEVRMYDRLRTPQGRLWLIGIMGAQAAAFALALHPISGAIGGILVLFLGFAVPTVLNIEATLLLVAFLPRAKHPMVLVPIAIAASLLFAVLPEATTIARKFTTPPAVTSTVRRSITVPAGELSLAAAPVDVVTNPLVQVIWMGSNEGCMCSYWQVLDSDAGDLNSSFASFFTIDLEHQIGPRTLGWVRDARQSVSILTTIDSKNPSLADIKIQVQEAGQVTAELHQRSVPRYPQSFIDADRKSLWGGPWLHIVWHLLTHGTFWSPILGPRLNFYPHEEVTRFLQRAVVVGSTSTTH